MASLFRPTYTVPLPEGAEVVTRQHRGKPRRCVRLVEDGKPAFYPLTAKGERYRVPAAKWYGQYADANGALQRVPLSENKTVAQQMLNDLVRKAELGKVGITDPYEDHRKRPLAEHLEAWESDLLAGGATAKHVKQTVACARRVIDGCGFVFPGDVSPSRVQGFLAGLRERGRHAGQLDPTKESYKRRELAAALGLNPASIPTLVRRHRLAASGRGKARRYPRATAEALAAMRSRGRSVKTSNLHLDAVKAFCNWMVRDRRVAENPLDHLSGGNVKLDRRHDRRALPFEEMRAVIQAARQSALPFRGLTGADRAVLYSVACASGFRAEELASLTPRAFDLAGDPPTVTLSAEDAKNGRTAVQPLPPDVAEALRGYLAGRPADRPVWPGKWFKHAAEMLRVELDACGIPYAVEGPDGPLYADFHALRHSFIALLDKSGATLKEAMQLARHSDPKLTMAIYGKAQLHDLGEAVGRLPALLGKGAGPEQEALRATGTDGACTNLAQASDTGRALLRVVDDSEGAGGAEGNGPKSQRLLGVESVREPVMVSEGSSPTRTRTWNKPVNSRLLYH